MCEELECVRDADCDDGNRCNGAETCDLETNTCLNPKNECTTADEYCLESADMCVECKKDEHCAN